MTGVAPQVFDPRVPPNVSAAGVTCWWAPIAAKVASGCWSTIPGVVVVRWAAT